jgi:hypothetical protein
MSGDSYLDYVGMPDWYSDRGQLAVDINDALLEAAEAVLNEWRQRDPLIDVALDGRWDLWTWAEHRIGDLPIGARVRSGDWNGTIAPLSAGDRAWHPGYVRVQWSAGTGYQPRVYWLREEMISARLPVPVDLGAAITRKAQDASP